MSWVDWLNQNSGAVQAIATIVLAVLTGFYVILTGQIARAARDQVQQALGVQRAAATQARMQLDGLIIRLLVLLDRLPGPEPNDTRIRGATLWTEEELQRFEHLTALVGGDPVEASKTIAAFRGVAGFVREVKETSPLQGFGWNPTNASAWARGLSAAREALTSTHASLPTGTEPSKETT